MVVGCLGDIGFHVSADVVEVINNITWSGKARYSTHQRHLRNALTEFTGIEPDEMSFDITLSAYLGVDPLAEMVKIWAYERDGEAIPLVIGERPYGKYRWSIVSHKIKMQYTDKYGNVTHAVVSVSLQEYLNADAAKNWVR